MRADEYLVELLKITKVENEKLKKEQEELLQQIDMLNHKNESKQDDDKSVNITETIGEVYELDYLSDYKIRNALEDKKITIEDLEQALVDDNKLLQSYDEAIYYIYYNEYRLAHVRIQKYNYLINYHDFNKAVLVIYAFSDCTKFECYEIDNKNYFLDYEQAKKAVIEKARDEIRKALDIFTGVKEQ